MLGPNLGPIEAIIDLGFNSPEKRADSQRKSRLIGVAPELLGACKQFLIAWEQWDDGSSGRAVYDSLARIRGAVAKAEGL